MYIRKTRYLATAVLSTLLLGSLATPGADAQEFPTEPVQLVVAFNPGGASDTLARQWGNFLPDHLRVPLIIDNIPGLNAIRGTRAFLERSKDCYNLIQMPEPFIILGMLRGELDVEIDDFAVINMEQFDRVSFTVREEAPFDDFIDLVEHMEANPGAMTVAYQPGAASEVLLQIMKNEMELDFRMVPYAGGGDLRTALLGGVVDAYSSILGGDRLVADEIKVLGVVGDTPAPEPFDARPFNEQLEQAGYEVRIPAVGSQRVLMAHRACKEDHPDRFQKLVDAYRAMLDSNEYQTFIAERDVAWMTGWVGPERSDELRQEMFETYEAYKDLLVN